MNTLTLQWNDAGQQKTQKIHEHGLNKNHGSVRIGRDPLRCDIVLSHQTVSGLHIEIYFHTQQQHFFLRNLREQNPPLVDGQQLVQGEVVLNQGSTIYLGQQQLKVIAVSIPTTSSVPTTILLPPQPPAANPQPVKPVVQSQPQVHLAIPPAQQAVAPGHHHPPVLPVQQEVYGLKCPKCHRVSSSEYLQVGCCWCRWCGTSLAGAASVLVAPNH
ncbi:FHA domain-containing protein [Brasilonema sp. UFV-L1]|uniref:FHA domain-containing protein n=1 Tax=Brasilonema sp. UFV-L1 TaxID=2234130 RepID=UPI00145D53DD|nr:FHA domain-containing protein [Brasilonema sp. UFV-L1]NMG07006.1 FHA domain-containing protein [Brasilonema sp. UFV-L1]